MPQTHVPTYDPPPFALPREALDGVRTRRVVALLIDMVVMWILCWVVGVVMILLALPTFGLAFALAPGIPFVGVFYSGFTVSGRGRATWGMRLMDLQVTDKRGRRLDFAVAAGHALLFWLMTPLLALVSLFSRDKRTLHDMLTGVMVTRRLTQP